MPAEFPTLSAAIAFTSQPLDATQTWTDVTDYLRFPLRVQRGRQHERNEIEAGTLDLKLDNQDRRFEPAWDAGPYYPIKVGRRIRVQATWGGTTYDVFQGFIERFEPKEDAATGDAWVDVSASDAFALFARTPLRAVLLWQQAWPASTTSYTLLRQPGKRKVVLTSMGLPANTQSIQITGVDFGGTARVETLYLSSATPQATSANEYRSVTSIEITPAGTTTGATLDVVADTFFQPELANFSLASLLNAILWPDNSANRKAVYSYSAVLLQAYDAGDSDALSALKRINASENGSLFINRSGAAEFITRPIRAATLTNAAIFGDGLGELPYSDAAWSVDDTQIANDVRVQRAGGVAQTAFDSASQDDYGARSLSKSNLLINSDAEALSLATFLLSRYKQPGLRVKRLELHGAAQPDDLWPVILGRELADRVRVTRRPTPAITYQQDSFVEAIQMTIDERSWATEWQLSPADAVPLGWIIGTSILGTDTYVAY